MSRHRFQNDEVTYFPALPSGWREERLHDICELLTSNIDKKSEEGEMPVRLCNYVNVYKNDKVTLALGFMEATATQGQIERFGLRVGDVVITKDSETPHDIGVPALVAETAADLVCGYHLTILRPNDNDVAGGYLFYAVASRLSAYQFYLAANGVTRFGLTYQGTKNVRIALPPLPEQKQLAAFLDWKTGQIDALIGKKKELLEKLREKRLAVITQAVTRGLNPAAPLRDSGIPWLGQVPEYWGLLPIKYLLNAILDTEHKTCPFYDDGEFLVARTPNIRDGKLTLDGAKYTDADGYREWTARGIPKAGDILFTREAPAGEACIVPDLPLLCIGQRVVLFRTVPQRLNSRYAIYSIYGGAARIFIEMHSLGSTVSHFNMSEIAMIPMLAPPLDEQAAIVEYLDARVGKIDLMMHKVETAIARLTEYRTALITAATTGKIDVCGVAVPEAGLRSAPRSA
jgi:type I restriction enzyme, S subunit